LATLCRNFTTPTAAKDAEDALRKSRFAKLTGQGPPLDKPEATTVQGSAGGAPQTAATKPASPGTTAVEDPVAPHQDIKLEQLRAQLSQAIGQHKIAQDELHWKQADLDTRVVKTELQEKIVKEARCKLEEAMQSPERDEERLNRLLKVQKGEEAECAKLHDLTEAARCEVSQLTAKCADREAVLAAAQAAAKPYEAAIEQLAKSEAEEAERRRLVNLATQKDPAQIDIGIIIYGCTRGCGYTPYIDRGIWLHGCGHWPMNVDVSILII